MNLAGRGKETRNDFLLRQWKENILPGSKSYNIFIDIIISKEETISNSLINRTTAEASIEFVIFIQKTWPLKEKPTIMIQTPDLHQKILIQGKILEINSGLMDTSNYRHNSKQGSGCCHH
jgi:hypothetical protein